jgi:glycerol-3-phosphate dehydrogenase
LAAALAGDLVIRRDLDALANGTFDVAIVGGGIHGVALALEAARRDRRVALVEMNDFGSASSGNSLRILHGGLRYLQTLDLPRFRDSVAARKWYAQHFPDLVRPLPCLMPLYGRRLRRPAVMRLALTANDALAAARNDGLAAETQLPEGRMLSRAETLAEFPAVRQQGLVGAALWYDYQMVSSERILIGMLHWAVGLGAVAANYVEAKRYTTTDGRFDGIVAIDRVSGRELVIRAPVIINAAGSASPELAARAGCAGSRFSPPSMAFNVLFDSPSMGTCAMAVSAAESGAATHFICPSRHGVCAGTAHLPRPRAAGAPAPPTEQEIAAFVAGLRDDVPDFPWSSASVRRIFSGFVPVSRAMTANLAPRADVIAVGGRASGLHSVVGIKYTTATQVAAQALNTILGTAQPVVSSEATASLPHASMDAAATLIDGDRAAALPHDVLVRLIRDVARNEAALEPNDFFERRTNWLFTARAPSSLRAIVESAFVDSSTAVLDSALVGEPPCES